MAFVRGNILDEDDGARRGGSIAGEGIAPIMDPDRAAALLAENACIATLQDFGSAFTQPSTLASALVPAIIETPPPPQASAE